MRAMFPVASVVLMAGLLAGCDIQVGQNGVSVDVAHGRASDEWRRSYTVSPGGRVEVTNVNGAIEVLAAAGSQVEILAERTVRSGSDEEAAVPQRFHERPIGGIEAHIPRRHVSGYPVDPEVVVVTDATVSP